MLGNVFVIKRQRLVEELSDDEVTEEEKNFDKTRLEINGNNNQQSELCRKFFIRCQLYQPNVYLFDLFLLDSPMTWK